MRPRERMGREGARSLEREVEDGERASGSNG
jgi:hypothetical protein